MQAVEELSLEFAGETLFHIDVEVSVEECAALHCTFLSYSIIGREVSVNLKAALSTEGRALAEVVEHVDLSSDFAAVYEVGRTRDNSAYFRRIWMQVRQQVCILGTHARHIVHEVGSEVRSALDFGLHPFETTE